MLISTITFTNCILYVSDIAKIWYTLTWWWLFDSDGLWSALWLKNLFTMLYERCCHWVHCSIFFKWNKILRVRVESEQPLISFRTLHCFTDWHWDNHGTNLGLSKCMADSRFAPSQWETSLQSNTVSHWLGAKLGSALKWITWNWQCNHSKTKHNKTVCILYRTYCMCLLWDPCFDISWKKKIRKIRNRYV